MSVDPGFELRRARDVGDLLGDGARLYFRHFGRWILIAAAVIVPIELIVSGLGLEQLFSEYDESPPAAVLGVSGAVSFLLEAPLTTAMTVYALLEIERGGRPSARSAIRDGLDAFTPIFFAVVLAAVGIALGLLLLVLPGIFLAVRWYLVPQAVVIDRARGADALRRSSELVRGAWWRVFGIALLVSLVAAIPLVLIQAPFELAADAADRAAISLAGAILSTTLLLPFVSIVATLLYFDLRARREAPALDTGAPEATGGHGPPDPPGLPPR